MKPILIPALLLAIASNLYTQGVLVSPASGTPDSSALMELRAPDKGFMLPRVNLLAANDATTIPNPAHSLTIYNTGQTLQPEGIFYNQGTPASPVWVLLVANPAQADLDMNGRSIINLPPPVNGQDAVNKFYVDNLVSAGGGGSGMAAPTSVSLQSPAALTFADAVQYCETLSEGGQNDWRLPTVDELAYFTKISGASTAFLWTKSLTFGKDFATNQNYIAFRLSDGKWTDGGINRFFFPNRNVNGSTMNSAFTPVATFSALNPGNLFVPTAMTWTGGVSTGDCSNICETRLKYNFPDGSFFYSNVNVRTCGGTPTFLNLSSIPILNESAAYLTIDVEVRNAGGSDGTRTGSLSITGYEISLSQIDGATRHCRCVRY
jgi:hypothetical protein